MKQLILKTIFFVSPFLAIGQESAKTADVKRNSVYFEAFGQGLYNSISFDRLSHIDKNIKTSFSAGLTLIPHPELFVIGVPISYNFIFGKTNHHLELGIGFTAMFLRSKTNASESYFDQNGVEQRNYFIGHETDFYSFFTPKIGYRYQKQNGGFFFRATFTPPIAGINWIGDTKGGSHDPIDDSHVEYFSSAAFFSDFRIFPWAGFSIGWTLKK